jgi:hypothetical protein
LLVLVLPLLAWAVSRTQWDGRTQILAVRAGVILYAVVALAAFAVSMTGAAA